MAQRKMNLLPAYGVPTEGECMVTIGVGTAERQVELFYLVDNTQNMFFASFT